MPAVTVSSDDYLYFVGRAVRGMAGIVTDLGDERCCLRPDVPGANTAYGLLTHCLGVIEYWAGGLVAGRDVKRDRLAEFTAQGEAAELVARADAVLAQLALDVAACEPSAPLRREPDAWAEGPDRPLTQGAALLHVYEELSQHHGQMQVLRDALVAPAREPDAFAAPLPWLRAKRGVKWSRPGPELLPAWVADMDFPIAAPIREAIQGVLDRGDLGYPNWPVHPLAEAFSERMVRRFGWNPESGHVRGVSDLIQGLQIVLDLTTRPGQAIVVHTPNYPPFLSTIATMQRRLLAAPLVPSGDGWTWDHDRLAADVADADAAALLLVNPQNPTGRVFTRAELEQVAELAEQHDLVVISDEIHADVAHAPHRHIPFASLGERVAARTVTLTSATKAFNIAGVRTAIAHVGPETLRQRWDARPPDLYGVPGVLGVEATLAAWRHGDAWLDGLRAQLLDRRDRLVSGVRDLPGVSMRTPEGGYLAWLDCRDAGLPGEAADWFREHAGVEMSPGSDFGPDAAGYARLNFATTAEILDAILDRMSAALRARMTNMELA